MELTPTLAHKHCSWKGTIMVYPSPATVVAVYSWTTSTVLWGYNQIVVGYYTIAINIRMRGRYGLHIKCERWPAGNLASTLAATRGSLCIGETRATRIRFFIFTSVHDLSGDSNVKHHLMMPGNNKPETRLKTRIRERRPVPVLCCILHPSHTLSFFLVSHINQEIGTVLCKHPMLW